MAYRDSIDLTDAVHSLAVQISTIVHSLSNRENEVIKLIAKSYQNNKIARMLIVSIETVEKHRANMIEKLGLDIVAVAGSCQRCASILYPPTAFLEYIFRSSERQAKKGGHPVGIALQYSHLE
jgi:DNA-binding CsgD family transcriptional regulator